MDRPRRLARIEELQQQIKPFQEELNVLLAEEREIQEKEKNQDARQKAYELYELGYRLVTRESDYKTVLTLPDNGEVVDSEPEGDKIWFALRRIVKQIWGESAELNPLIIQKLAELSYLPDPEDGEFSLIPPYQQNS